MKIRALIVAAGMTSALAVVGCGGSTPISSAPAGNSSAPAPVSTQSAPAPASGKSIDVCSALPATTASQITGTKLTTTKTRNTEGVIFECEYGGPDSALLQVSVDIHGGTTAFDSIVAALKAVNHPPNRVSGVGDEAFSEPNPEGNAGAVGAAGFASYGAVFGDDFIKIGGLTYVTADQGKQIVELLHTKL
ncbi:MAG TPA: hypothetical protein VFI65_14425 [Streptosporangiaceae bacterium]|nr:hypothetical protein [Streptosporangiaceae bacterium]